MARPAKLRPASIDAYLSNVDSRRIDQVMETFGSRPTWYVNERAITGRKAVQNAHAEFFRAFPDYRVRILHRHLATGVVVAEGRMRGTQRGAWLGIPATRRRFEIPCCMVFQTDRRGRIGALRQYFDGALLLAQLHILPERSRWLHSAATKPTRMA
jgi:steroid delta-isomerase-like uncharacterized protein